MIQLLNPYQFARAPWSARTRRQRWLADLIRAYRREHCETFHVQRGGRSCTGTAAPCWTVSHD